MTARTSRRNMGDIFTCIVIILAVGYFGWHVFRSEAPVMVKIIIGAVFSLVALGAADALCSLFTGDPGDRRGECTTTNGKPPCRGTSWSVKPVANG